MAVQMAPRRIVGVTTLQKKAHTGHRIGLTVVSIVPLIGVGIAIWSLWGHGLSMTDAGIFAGLYAFTGLGVTVGFHRMLAHRTFEAPKAVRAVLAIGGSMSIEMGAIDWAATHRRHHAYSDMPGDPHSPHLEAENGWRGIVKGLWYAHMGWLFSNERTSRERWTPDLMKDPAMVKITDLFPSFVALTFVLPAVLGLVITRSFTGMLTALLWGGLVRVFLLHHVTFSINSLCHFFGTRPYETKEKSVNFWPLAVLSFGESWHNNHHAFPASSSLGLRWWQLDPGTWLLAILRGLGLARNLKRPARDEIVTVKQAA